MLSAVLTYTQPYEWEAASYDSDRYHLFELSPGEEEYTREVNPFVNGSPRIEVTSLQRVQNPFQLGRFLIRKEQKQYRNEHVEVVKYYHPINKADLKIALEHNMDIRRYSHKYPTHQVDGKNPKFFKTPSLAENTLRGITDKAILICNLLGTNYEPSFTSKPTDTEYMPTYVASLT